MASPLPHHSSFRLEDATFFSDFDSGNLARVERTAFHSVRCKQYEVWVAPDAVDGGNGAYRTWFHFGIKELETPAFVKLTIVNLTPMKCLYATRYRPVWKVGAEEWKPVESEVVYEPLGEKCAKLSWNVDVVRSGDVFFAFTYPYPCWQVVKTIDALQSRAPDNTYFYREVLSRSLDGHDVELLTISDLSNLSEERESRMLGLFPTYIPRCHK